MTAPAALKVLRPQTAAGYTGRRLSWVTAICCVAFGLALVPSSASAATCGPPTRAAYAFGNNIWAGVIPNFGSHGIYDIGMQSYLQRCGPNVTRARHQVYIDTRIVPRNQKFGFNIWTRRSDGRWQGVKPSDRWFNGITGARKIQEKIRYQYRTTYPPARLTHVKIKYWVFDVFPIRVHTVTVAYRRFLGPQAGPRR